MRRSRWIVAVGVLAMVGASCSGDDTTGSAETTSTAVESAGVDGSPPDATPISDADRTAVTEAVGDGGCDELDTTRCLLPFPSDRFTVKSDTTDNGLLVALPTDQLANTAGKALDPAEWNRNDGFSPGSPLMTLLPDVDLVASGAPTIGDISVSMDDDSPTVVVDLDTGERLGHWIERDIEAPAGEQLAIIRGAASWQEGHRIGVAFRSLRTVAGNDFVPSAAFRAYRDNLTTDIDAIESRRSDMEDLFGGLAEAGVTRADLQLAWSFTVSSQRSLSERMLTIRDDAFERLGSASPTFQVNEVLETGLPPGVGRRVNGRFDVPLYLTGDGEPGSSFNTGPDGLPVYADKSFSAYFTCQIPASALEGDGGTARPVVYGHGLMGGAGEAENSQVAKLASTNTMMYCATDWIGMSAADIGNVAGILQDISRFPTLVDRGQQGILNTLFLARAMKLDSGFGTAPAFQNAAGQSVIDGTEVYYDGNSQGGIIGGAATAVAQDWKRAVLGVPGMNYSLLLNRSVDFDSYFAVLRAAYPNAIDQELIIATLQQLWDRAEGNGYAQHMTEDPYPGTPAHRVLLHVGFGDHQVAPVAAEIMARTIGAKVRGPALEDGRHPDPKPFFGLEIAADYPIDGSALVYWDSGTLAPPEDNITPVESEAFKTTCAGLSKDEQERSRECADSHEDPRRATASILQKDLFFRPDGRIEDTCNGKPCIAENRFTLDY